MKRIKLFEEFLNESVGQKGLDYEVKIHSALNSAGIDDLDTGEKPGAGFSNQGAGDLELKLGGKPFNVEVKLDAGAQMGGTSFRYDSKAKTLEAVSKKIPKSVAQTLISIAQSKAKDIDNYIQAANALHKAMGIEYVADGVPIKVAVDVRNKLKSKGFLKKINITKSIPNKFIIDHYNKKGVNYINIGGSGLFYIGDNPLGLPVPKFDPEIVVELRLAFSGGKVSFNVKGKEIPARNAGFRAQARLKKFKDQSPYNLDDPESIKQMFSKMKK